MARKSENTKEPVITRTIATGHNFTLYEQSENAMKEVCKVTLDEKRVSEKQVKQIALECGVEKPEMARLVYNSTNECKYTMPLSVFMKYATAETAQTVETAETAETAENGKKRGK